MIYKDEYRVKSNQSNLIFKKLTVEKRYLLDFEKNKLSSVKNEIHCLNKFSVDNVYAPEIIDVGETSYTMKRYAFSLGSPKRISEPRVRTLLFFCSLAEILKQLNEIENILKQRKILHRDLNPGNILFSKEELKLKLIDFYWASTDNINCEPIIGVNGVYGDDPKAFSTIRKQISDINKQIEIEVAHSKKNILSHLGETYLDGSAEHVGKTYHPIDISYYKDRPYHKDIDYEFQNIIKNIKRPIKSVIDIGCAAGYYSFNFMRMYGIEKVLGYEADPNMLAFLKKVKDIFCLDEFILNSKVDDTTEFPDVDLVICMNVHMWLEKQLGKKADIIVSNLIKHSKEMFFQTAGANNSGLYKVKSLKSKEEVQKYLERLGEKKVVFIDRSKHGGKRYLFKIGNI